MQLFGLLVMIVATAKFNTRVIAYASRAYSGIGMTFEAAVLKYLTCECRISDKNPTYVLLSVSGGLDSIAMLHLMANIRSTTLPNITLAVANFNHKCRLESDEEV